MSRGRLRLWTELAGPVINPNIYGHFAEHLGRCTYEGIWVGPESKIPNDRGMRLDVLAALKHLRAPMMRWPGGCFADNYHWRDGIGPREKRPDTVNLWWRQTEPNDFGTDEFMMFCNAVGCAPYLCVNVGSGTPKEAAAWVEYCNFAGDSSLTGQRAHNATAQPYDVRYWGVGNENWGCGGRMEASDYVREYRRYASYMRGIGGPIELVACGALLDPGEPKLEQWNLRFCQEMREVDLVDHLSIHRYFKRGSARGFTDSEYRSLFGDLAALENDILQTERLLRYFYPRKQVGIAIDEWGVWHPAAVTENGLEQDHALRDAVFAGAALNLMNRHARCVSMANIAQVVNVLQSLAITDGSHMFLSPTYYVYDMMRPHIGGRLLTDDLECDQFETTPTGLHRKHATPYLSISASRRGDKVHLTVANQTPDQDVELDVAVRDAGIGGVTGRVLHSNDPRDANTVEHPRMLCPRAISITPESGEVTHVFPAHSFTALTLSLT